jgi:YHS domain-containing protein
MLKLLFFGILAYFVFRFVQKVRLSGGGNSKNAGLGPVDEMVQDPNCLTYIPKGSAIRKSVAGETHFFCSQKCIDEFRRKK